jgi:hypothetical protein
VNTEEKITLVLAYLLSGGLRFFWKIVFFMLTSIIIHVLLKSCGFNFLEPLANSPARLY